MNTNDFDQMVCCDVVTMFGYSLKKGTVIVCITTFIVASITLAISVLSIAVSNNEIPYSTRPVAGVGLLFGLYCYGIASYQIFISALLLWSTIKRGGSVYACTLWYISHLSIIFGYCCFFIAGTVTCIVVQKYVYAAVTLVVGTLYCCTYGYFCVVVNSYSYTIGQPVFY